jgi:hypothetical protein
LQPQLTVIDSAQGIKTCTDCELEKVVTAFYKYPRGKFGVRSVCIDCYKIRNKLVYCSSYNTVQCRKWAAVNRLRSNAIKKAHFDRSITTRLASSLRNRMWYALAGRRSSASVIKLLGCSSEELKNHLESKFRPGMTWKNRSPKGWHIDHIEPLATFDLTDPAQLARACHYTNLQPLWAVENLSKGARRA